MVSQAAAAERGFDCCRCRCRRREPHLCDSDCRGWSCDFRDHRRSSGLSFSYLRPCCRHWKSYLPELLAAARAVAGPVRNHSCFVLLVHVVVMSELSELRSRKRCYKFPRGEEEEFLDNDSELDEDRHQDKRIVNLSREDIMQLEFIDEDVVYQFYKTYALIHDFDGHQEENLKTLTWGDRQVHLKEEVEKDEKIRGHQPLTRSRCPARIRARLGRKKILNERNACKKVKNNGFLNDFKKFIYANVSVEEFEVKGENMVEKYNLSSNSWADQTYE
ncbi:hypothetical protein Ahy_B06g082017 [Arachis hypogaea]|uniref:Protein FAR1-RELATED SEQUENCE n=1 Tax=Arachis hypogaea TaxID=3818 RepID=A0A444YMP8_ARAHY|nr:hypothetical protein Ahy_B06g082017 [Arachis hypogaea]